ncbi:MAG: hypothetical protein ACK5MA_04955 [Parachlamydiaceae bacterium]
MTSPLENTSKIFAKAADRPDQAKRYVKLKEGSARTSRHKRSNLKDVFEEAQADIRKALLDVKRGERREVKVQLQSLIESTEALQERYSRRAGNLLVRIGLFTPKTKRETLKAARELIDTAEAAIHVLEHKNPVLEISDEDYQKLEGNDPNYILSLLEKAGERGAFNSQKERLESLATEQCAALAKLFIRNVTNKKNIVFEKGRWVAKRMAREDTMEERNQQVHEQLMRYMPHINYRRLSQEMRGVSFRGTIATLDTSLGALQALSRENPINLNAFLNNSRRQLAPMVVKYYQDWGQVYGAGEEQKLRALVWKLGPVPYLEGLFLSVFNVKRLGWNADFVDLAQVHFSGLLDHDEFRKTDAIFSQLRRLQLPSDASFSLRAGKYALQTAANLEESVLLYRNLHALQNYNNESMRGAGSALNLLLDPQLRKVFRKDFAKLIAFSEEKLPPDADLHTWREFIIWKNVKVNSQEAESLYEQLQVWHAFEAMLVDNDTRWDDDLTAMGEQFFHLYRKDLFYSLQDDVRARMPLLHALMNQKIPKEANLYFRLNAYLCRMAHEGKITNRQEADTLISELKELHELQQAIEKDQFPMEKLERFEKLLYKYTSEEDFVDLFYGDFRTLFHIAARHVPEEASIPMRALLYVIAKGLKGEEARVRFNLLASNGYEEMQKQLQEGHLDSAGMDNLVSFAFDFADKDFKRMMDARFPLLEAIIGSAELSEDVSPQAKGLSLIYQAYKNENMTLKSAQKVYQYFFALSRLERNDRPVSPEEQRSISKALFTLLEGKKEPQFFASLRPLIPKAFHYATPHEDDPYFIAAVHYAANSENARKKEVLKLLMDIHRLDELLPVQGLRWINETTPLRNRVAENSDENVLNFVRSKLPYTAYAIEVMKNLVTTAEEALFWGENNRNIFEEEEKYLDAHLRSGKYFSSLYHNLAFGDCTVEIGGNRRKVASWFIKTALPESAYEVKEGRLQFTDDWTEEELNQLLEYCYTGQLAPTALQISFAKKAKEQGLEGLYRTICAGMIKFSDIKSTAALYPEAKALGLSHLAQGLLKLIKMNRSVLADLPEGEREVRLALIKTLPDDGQPHADWSVEPLPRLDNLEDLGLVKDYALIGRDKVAVMCNKNILSLNSNLFTRVDAAQGFSGQNTAKQARFKELDSAALTLAVRYAYGQINLDEISEGDAARLWDAAKVLEMPRLKERLTQSYDIQEDEDILNHDAMEMALQFKNTGNLPVNLTVDALLELYDVAEVMEMQPLKTALVNAYGFLKIELFRELIALDVQRWRDAGVAIDDARNALASRCLPPVQDLEFIEENQDLILIPGGLRGEELEGFIFALVEDENLKGHLIALIQANKIESMDQWILIYKREMGENEQPEGYTVHNHIAFKSIAII